MRHHMRHFINTKNTKSGKKSVSQDQQKQIYLLKQSYKFNVFKSAPKLFTITSNSSSYKFNIEFLSDASSLIKDQLSKDPHNLQYNLLTENGENIMKRIELLFLGSKVSFLESEENLFFEVITELKMNSSINLRKRNSTAPPRSNNYSNDIIINGHRRNNGDFDLDINQSNFNSYLSEKMKKTFTISTKSNEYKCNIIGITSSKLLSELLSKDPYLTQYEYDFGDECNEFQSICHFFNFQKVELTTDNMNLLKTIAEDFQIDIIMNELDNFIDDYNQRIQVVDDQQSIIDSIDELFKTLSSIKEETVDSVKEYILDSNWCKTEEEVQELVAFILQLIRTNNLLHTYLADLIESLDKEANESNKLNILIPFIVKRLFNIFDESNFISNFVYILYKRGIIQKDDVLKKLDEQTKKKESLCNGRSYMRPTHQKDLNFDSFIIFLPEIAEIVNRKDLINFFSFNIQTFIRNYIGNNFEKFKLMRDENEPSDQITKALRDDDVDTLQKLITMNHIKISKQLIPYNIFDDFDKISYINYSAAYGSIKCFKYLLVNHADLDESSFKLAVFGGNIEIIRLIDQQPKESFQKETVGDSILPTITKHQDELFEWIIDNKYTKAVENKQLVSNILTAASKNGDILSIKLLIDRGFDFKNLNNDLCRSIMANASKNGFYKLLEFISIALQPNLKNLTFDRDVPVYYGNLSIFKFYHSKTKIYNLIETITIAVENNYNNIIRYAFDNLFDEISTDSNKESVYKLLSTSIQKDTEELFEYLFSNFENKLSSLFFFSDSKLISLLSEACYINNVSIAHTITEFLLDSKYSKVDFSLPFFNAAVKGSLELCTYFLDKKVSINFDLISLQYRDLATVSKDIFDIIYKNIAEESKEIFINFYLEGAIFAKNKSFIEYLLKQNAVLDNALFKAVETNDIEIVDLVLKYKNDPSFINQRSKEGTALNVAVSSKSQIMVEHLLSIPGIDPNIPEDNAPLINAISKSYVEIAKLLINNDAVNVNVSTNQVGLNKKTALTLAVQNNLDEIVDLLINNKKFDPIESRLNYAFYLSNDNIAEKLSKIEGVDVNYIVLNNEYRGSYIRNDENRKKYDYQFYSKSELYSTPLTSAVNTFKTKKIDIIVNHPNFDPVKSMAKLAVFTSSFKNTRILKNLTKLINIYVNDKNESGKSLLEIACKSINKDLVDEILKNENFDSKKCDFVNIFKNCLTDFGSNLDILKILVEYDQAHDKLIDFKKLLPNGKSYFTVLYGFKSQIKLIVNFLLENGVDPNVPDKYGVYPLEHAIKSSNDPFVESLIDSNKIDYSQKVKDLLNKKGWGNKNAKATTTYFHLTINSNFDVFKLFIDKELMDINVVDSNGETILMKASRLTKIDFINKLFEMGDLDYLHRNKKGKDAIDIANVKNKSIKPPKSRSEYRNVLVSLLNDKMLNANNNNNNNNNNGNGNGVDETKTEDDSAPFNCKPIKFNFDNIELDSPKAVNFKFNFTGKQNIAKADSILDEVSGSNNNENKDEKPIDFVQKSASLGQNQDSKDPQNPLKFVKKSQKPNNDSNSPVFQINFPQKKSTKDKTNSLKSHKDKETKDTSFAFNFNKKSEIEKDSMQPSNSNSTQESDKDEKNVSTDRKNDLTPHSFVHKTDQVIDLMPQNELKIGNSAESTENADIQKEIEKSILGSLENLSQDEAERISKVISSIVKREAEKIATKVDVQNQNNSKEISDETEAKNQFKIEPKTIDSTNINDDESEDFKQNTAVNSNPRDLLSRKSDFIDDDFEYLDDQNQFNYQNHDFNENQMMMHQWNQVMQSYNMRNAQFNMIMHQQEQMLRSLVNENHKKSKSSKNKSKKSKRKDHK